MVSQSETLSLSDLRTFLEVAKQLSVTGAGNTLGVAKSAISKTLTRLEKQLEVKLLERSSRRIALTPAGHLLAVKATSLLSEAEFLTYSLREERSEPSGLVRMTAPAELGALFIERVLPALMQEYPRLRIAMKLSYEFDDMLDPAIDIALRVGQVHDDRLVCTTVGDFARCAVASPAFLDAHPVGHPLDLGVHPCLIFSSMENAAVWSFEKDDAQVQVQVTSALSAQSFTALLHAARAGLGVARAPRFIVAEWLERGDLVEVLPQWRSSLAAVYVVRRFGHERIARVMAVMQAIQKPGWLMESPSGP